MTPLTSLWIIGQEVFGYDQGKNSLTKIELKIATKQDEQIVQNIFEAAPTYFCRVDGSEVGPLFAQREMKDEAKKKSESYQKIFCLVYYDQEPIGVVDLHKDHPSVGTVYIGLLLIVDRLHGRNIGREVYSEVERFAARELGATKIKLGVSDRNQVDGFWTKMGFSPNGFKYNWKGETVESTVTEMEKVLC